MLSVLSDALHPLSQLLHLFHSVAGVLNLFNISGGALVEHEVILEGLLISVEGSVLLSHVAGLLVGALPLRSDSHLDGLEDIVEVFSLGEGMVALLSSEVEALELLENFLEVVLEGLIFLGRLVLARVGDGLVATLLFVAHGVTLVVPVLLLFVFSVAAFLHAALLHAALLLASHRVSFAAHWSSLAAILSTLWSSLSLAAFLLAVLLLSFASHWSSLVALLLAFFALASHVGFFLSESLLFRNEQKIKDHSSQLQGLALSVRLVLSHA